MQYYAPSCFNVCEHQPLPMMTGPPLSMTIDPDAIPKPQHHPIPVPLHWQKEVKDGLDRDVALGVLEEVPIGTPVTWLHRMVICPKKNGSLRRTIDLQDLNKHATRETHHTIAPFHQARSVPHHSKKTIFDAWNGYHSVALEPKDRHMTTFLTPWGRYRYRTAPQGYIASGDGYTRRYDALISDTTQRTKCIDDALLWADSTSDAYHRAVEWLQICSHNGITLNPTKFVFARDEVDFAGFTITPTQVKPAPKFTSAIRDFPTPINITDVRSWFGLINQVAYTFSMTKTMAPFRDLLKPTSTFQWTEAHAAAFTRSKEHITTMIHQGVQIFNPDLVTCLTTDWSKEGIGYWLLQKHCRCPSTTITCCQDGWKTTLVGSRFTHSAEARYAPIEGEALAVAVALEKTQHFTLGCKKLIIAVDHKPLLKILGDRSLTDIHNTRIRNLKERTLRFQFQMVHIPGVTNKTSDALSRHPTGPTNPDKMTLQDDEDDTRSHLIAALTSVNHTTWEELQSATLSDPTLQSLAQTILEGFPNKCSLLPPCLTPYFPYRQT